MKIVNSIQPEPEAAKPPLAAPVPRVIPIPITIVEPVETPVDPAPLFDEIERMKNTTLQDLRQIEDRLKLADAEGMELIRRNAADIARLALEFDTLKKVLVELTKRMEKKLEPEKEIKPPVPIVQTSPIPEPVTEAPTLVPIVQPPTIRTEVKGLRTEPEKDIKPPVPIPQSSVLSPQSSPIPDPEKKVALFDKLWNYLNQNAPDAPPSKTNRPR